MSPLQFQCPICFNMTMVDLDQMDDLPTLMEKVEKTIVLAVWDKNGRNGAATARDLGIEEYGFRYLKKKYKLDREKVSHLNCTHA